MTILQDCSYLHWNVNPNHFRAIAVLKKDISQEPDPEQQAILQKQYVFAYLKIDWIVSVARVDVLIFLVLTLTKISKPICLREQKNSLYPLPIQIIYLKCIMPKVKKILILKWKTPAINWLSLTFSPHGADHASR